MKKVCLLIIAFVIFSTISLSQNLNKPVFNFDKQADIKISAKDKAQIVEAVLSNFDFLNRKLTSGETKEIVRLSTENIELKSVSKVYGVKFALIDLQEIQERAKTGFSYFAFQEFKAVGSKVYVSFAKIYVDSGFRRRNPSSSGSPDSVTGVKYEFKKVSGRWQGKIVSGFQKQS